MREELIEQAGRAVELAREAGADDVVAGVSWSRGTRFEWREGRLERVQESTSRKLGLAVYVDGRYSTSSTNDLEPGRLAGFAREAVDLTRCLEVDPHRRITPAELYEGRAELDLDLVDRSLGDLSREQRIDWCREMDERARAHPEVQTAETSVSDSQAIGARVTSNGFEGSHEESSVWIYAGVSVRDGDRRPEEYDYAGALHLEDLPAPAGIADEALRKGLSRLGSRQVSSRRTRMIVEPQAAGRLLGRLLGALSAGAIQQKRSFLADHLDQPIASSLLTLTDDPLRVRGMGSELYDGEGIAARPRTVIEGGVLRTYFVDTYYGSKLGWEPTTGGSSNIVFEHGERDLEGILAATQDGIHVTTWLGGNADMTTGDFSFGLRGFLVEGGEVVQPVSEMNITGNYGELLQRLCEVGNDPVPWSSFLSPTLVFEDVQFSGS